MAVDEPWPAIGVERRQRQQWPITGRIAERAERRVPDQLPVVPYRVRVISAMIVAGRMVPWNSVQGSEKPVAQLRHDGWREYLETTIPSIRWLAGADLHEHSELRCV